MSLDWLWLIADANQLIGKFARLAATFIVSHSMNGHFINERAAF